MADVSGLGAGQLVASNRSEFIDELNGLMRPPLWPWILVATIVITLIGTPTIWVPVVALPVGLTATVLVAVLRSRHKVTVEYEVEGDLAAWHTALRNQWPEIRQVQGIWRVVQQGATQTPYRQKINAGAGHLVRRERVTVSAVPHGRMKSNIELPTLTAGKHSLALLPDHILVRTDNQWNELDYSNLRINSHPQRFIESDTVPRDSERVGTTWQYVNKNGGPDRRFNNNRQLPVMLYGELELTTPNGLRWMLQLSRPHAAASLAASLQSRP